MRCVICDKVTGTEVKLSDPCKECQMIIKDHNRSEDPEDELDEGLGEIENLDEDFYNEEITEDDYSDELPDSDEDSGNWDR